MNTDKYNFINNSISLICGTLCASFKTLIFVFMANTTLHQTLIRDAC